ncbi:tyrosine-type recombinase/integrase [Amycolatopsis saalfeldensis]|uniref:Site-specific recombinase XerD n=1 Tax=Amycolatopsis saalfeldensis TaxID=394193 RepID=A0A1H8YG77_9PSEU|nr:site-specific integrase [Amycolatopsis saalfeldensis]SEP51063.1 Site-specific recombinase XerD [Amycolatopsis saalfeldensis]
MGHIQDRWFRDQVDPVTGDLVLNKKNKPVQERTELYGKGLRYKVRYLDPDKVERSKSFPDGKLTEAQKYLTKMENAVYDGTYADPKAGEVQFGKYAWEVLAGRSRDESTVASVKDRMDSQVIPFLGRKLLRSFTTPELIRKWLAWMAEQDNPVSVNYQRQVFDLVSSILDAAVADGKIKKNPCRDKSIKAPVPVARKVTPWKESRRHRVELALPARFKPCATLGTGLGLRQGEIFAFSPDNIDRDRMEYRCTRQMVTVNGVRKFKLPKGHKTRVIPLGYGVLDEIDAYMETYPPVEITLPWGEQDAKEFDTVTVLMTNKVGGLYTRQAFNNVIWRPTFKRAGLSYEDREDGMHAMRHLFASAMLERGVSLKELAAFLGHSSEAFTLKTYTHLMPSSHDRARAAIDDLIKPRRKPQAAGETA